MTALTPSSLIDELRRIITETSWTPAERIVVATLLLNAESDGDWRIVDNMTAKRLAEMAGISERSAHDILPRLRDAGIVQYTPETATVNRMGEPIPAQAVNFKHGDRFIKTPYAITIPSTIGDLPALADSANATKARTASQARRREFAEIKTQLDNLLSGMACPHCGEVGKLHGEIVATCTSCGTKLDEQELSIMIDGEELPRLQSLQFEPELPRLQSLQFEEEPSRLQNLPDTCLETANFAVSDEALSISASAQPAFDVLTGEATIRYLAGLSAKFSLVDGKAGINPRSDDGMDELNYLDCPMSAEAAISHLKRRGNVGLLPQHSDMAVIDVDAGAPAFIREHGALAMGVRIFRDNAPERVKLIVFCPDAGDSIKKITSADGTREIEIIGKRKHAIIAGVHESGAEIKCEVAHELPIVEWARLVEIAREWTGTATAASVTTASFLSASCAAHPQSAGDQLKAALIWWMQQPVNIAAVDALVKTHAKGKYVAVRPERTPSTRCTGEFAGRRTWRDYGANETLDDYEIYCRLNGIDKRAHKWEVVNQWRETQGRQPLKLQASRHERFERRRAGNGE